MKIQEQLMALREKTELRPNNGSQANIVTLPLFNREASKIGGFVTTCKLYLRMRLRKTIME